MGVDTNKALQDITYLSNRFSGLIALGEAFQEAQTLLNQRESVRKAIEEASKVLANKRDEIKQAEAALDKLDEDWRLKKATLNSDIQASVQDLKTAKDRVTASEKEYDSIIQKAKDEAKKIMDKAKADAEVIQQLSDAKVKETASRLAEIQDKIDRIKASI